MKTPILPILILFSLLAGPGASTTSSSGFEDARVPTTGDPHEASAPVRGASSAPDRSGGADPAIADLVAALARVDSLLEAGRAESAVALGETLLGRVETAGGERVAGGGSEDLVIRTLLALGRAERAAGSYDTAEGHLRAALRGSEGAGAAETRTGAQILSTLGVLLIERGRYEEAGPLLMRSIEIRRGLPGPYDPGVAAGLNSLAVLNMRRGRYAAAESLYLETIAVQERGLGRDNAASAKALTNLGVLYRNQGRYHEAEPLLKRGLRLTDGSGSPDPDLLAWQIDMLSVLYYLEGRYGEAEPFARRSLAIRTDAFGADHPETALALNSLGLICLDTGRLEEAESLIRRALAIEEKALGPDHPRVASRLNNLGTIRRLAGRPEEAEPLLRRALAIKEKRLGPENPMLGSSLNSLGSVLMQSGRFEEAERFVRRGLEVRRRGLGEGHPQVAFSEATLARLCGRTGRAAAARRAFLREVGIRRDFTAYLFGHASEGQKLQQLREYPPVDGALISFALEDTSEATVRAALDMVLHGKALVIDAVAAEREYAYASYDDHVREAVRRYREICGAISTLTFSGPGRRAPGAYPDSLRALDAVRDSLETVLSGRCGAFRDEIAARRFEIGDVASAIPPGAVLWEILRYAPYDFDPPDGRGESAAGDRYAGFTLDRTGATRLADLGPAAVLDSLVEAARGEIEEAPSRVYAGGEREAEGALAGITRRLHALLVQPLLSRSGAAATILVSPDGSLGLLPLEILAGPDGRYVIEDHAVVYLSSGRDLLARRRGKDGEAAGREIRPDDRRAVVVSDPAFGEPGTGRVGQEPAGRISGGNPAGEASSADAIRPIGRPACAAGPFDPLERSREEGRAVARLLGTRGGLRVALLSGAEASEEAIKRERAPRVLHLATHGFFCPAEAGPDGFETVSEVGRTKAPLDNPLLRGGLVLAGANEPPAPRGSGEERAGIAGAREDGLLTALEVSGLDLRGTELVVLSACETGVGDVRSGEGVFGLRRAFRLAGAESVLMSLWTVPDRQTFELMERFYTDWLEGRPRPAALRRAELDLLEARRREKGAAHPLFWGGFILAGE